MIRKALTLVLAIALLPLSSDAKGYSGGGRSYSSGRTSSSSSRSSSSGSSSRSSGSSKSYSSGAGRTYSSGAATSKSPSSSSGRTYSSGSSSGKSAASPGSNPKTVSSSSGSSKSGSSSSSGSSFSFDSAAARAQKEAASQRDFATWKKSQSSESPGRPSLDRDFSQSPSPRSSDGGRSYSASSRQPVFRTDPQAYATRTVRVEHHYAPYFSRPVVFYNDHYSSFFWWWLLDRSLDDRANWAYHHRADMDGARYQALLATDTNLEARVRQLEAQRSPIDPAYVPTGLDRDLMYTDQYVRRGYVTRPTTSGRVFFWLIMVPTAIGTAGFLVWLVFYKRWQTA